MLHERRIDGLGGELNNVLKQKTALLIVPRSAQDYFRDHCSLP